MSLDITLKNEEGEELFWKNITHNLAEMANVVGIYRHLWRPEELNITKAEELIKPLKVGIDELLHDSKKYKQYSASNGWGTYEQFIPWLIELKAGCEEFPNATIHISR